MSDINEMVDMLTDEAPQGNDGPGGIPLETAKIVIRHVGFNDLDEKLEGATDGSNLVRKSEVLLLLAPPPYRARLARGRP